MLQASTKNVCKILFAVLHKKNLHEIVQIAIKDSLSIRSLMTRAEILDHLVVLKGQRVKGNILKLHSLFPCIIIITRGNI
jgi:hypothetical protein